MQPYDRVIFRSASITIGRWDCPPDAPDFHDTGPTEHYLVVFPRTAVEIEQDGAEPVIGDPSIAMLYNQAQGYTRRRIGDEGDQCDWFGFNEEVAREIMADVLGGETRVDSSVFQQFVAPCDPQLYLRQRLLVEHLDAEVDHDAMLVEETALGIVRTALALAHRPNDNCRTARRDDTTKAHRDLTHQAKAILAHRFAEGLSLEDLAREVHCSSFHLCRVFRDQTGMTLTAFRNEQRLRRALDRLSLERDHDLTRLALETGFSSHSHFTRSFRKAFGTPPSSLRRVEPGRLLRQLGMVEPDRAKDREGDPLIAT